MPFRKVSRVLARVVLAVVVLGAAGCDDSGSESSEAPGPMSERWNAQGDRVVVRERGGDPVAKFRLRSRRVKVYDADFQPVGYIRTDGDQSLGAEGDGGEPARADAGRPGERREIQLRRLDADRAVSLRRIEPDVWAVDRGVRIERTADGWAVFDREATWIGEFARTEEGWQLTREREPPVTWRVESRDGGWVATADGEVEFRVEGDRLAPETLLAVALEEIPLLERVAVGHWLEQRASRGDSSPPPE